MEKNGRNLGIASGKVMAQLYNFALEGNKNHKYDRRFTKFGNKAIKAVKFTQIEEKWFQWFVTKYKWKLAWRMYNCSVAITRKSLNSRMGKGKGSVDRYVGQVQKGCHIIEYNTL